LSTIPLKRILETFTKRPLVVADMNSRSSLVDTSRGVLHYAILLSILVISYQVLSAYFIAPYWPLASTFTVILFPVCTYLLLQYITVKHFNGAIKPVVLFFSGMLLHWLCALCVSVVLYISYQLKIDLYNTGSAQPSYSFLVLAKGFFRWYSIFGIVSSPLGILVLYAKSRFSSSKGK